MSRRPGIGAGFAPEIASTVLEFNLVELEGDVPSALQHGKRKFPLGRYMRRQIRKHVGMDEKAPQSTIDKAQELLQPLREDAFNNSQPFKKTVVEAHDNKVLQMETKQRIFKKRGNI